MEYVVISRRMPRYLVGLGGLGIVVVLAVCAFVGVRLSSAAASTPPLGVKRVDKTATFQPTRLTPGTYKYICAPHETSGKLGEVVVQ